MRNRLGLTTIRGACKLLAGVALAVASTIAAQAQSPTLEQLLSGVVHIKTFITPDGRTTENLGREREGTGIVIDNNGLILTIGWLMVEAISAEITTNDGRTVGANVVGYDNESGFGLLQTTTPLNTNGTEITPHVRTTDQAAARLRPGMNGIESCVTKHRASEMLKNSE